MDSAAQAAQAAPVVLTALDVGVLVALGLGGLIGLALGFIRAGLFALSWIGATAATVYGFPYARPYARQWIETQLFADLTTGVALFVVVLVVLFVISSLIGDWVRASRLNAVDRSLGALAGFGATALLIVAAYLVAASVWAVDDRPTWMRQARALELIEPGAALLMSLIPDTLGTAGAPQSPVEGQGQGKGKGKGQGKSKGKADAPGGTNRVVQELMAPKPKGPAAADKEGYGTKERQEMERLHDSIQSR